VTSRPSFAPFRTRRGWYTLSVDALRGWLIFGSLLALAGAGYFGYRLVEDYNLRGEAEGRIAEARQLAARVQQTRGASRFRSEYETGWRYLQTARRAFEEGDFRGAAREGSLARNVLLAILDSLDHRGGAGDASFIAIAGRVEYRRGGAGDWQAARTRVALAEGDYVRTAGNGSAEIMFADGTLYTVRPNTSFVVSATGDGAARERAIAMDYGWVNLNTASRPARVTTPSAEARVGEESEAYVAYDAAEERARFGAFRGSLEIAAGEESITVAELEEAQQVRGRLTAVRPLPGRPQAVEPSDNLEIDAAASPELVLAWRPVEGAARYALQVSRQPLFADNVIDVADRAGTRATLGLRGEGSFLWRVAALDRAGARGPWSPARRFRVAAPAGDGGEAAAASAAGGPAGDGADRTPPALDLAEVTPYGNIFIVRGSTEPGSTVEIAGEPASVAADGSFTKTIQLNQEGWSSIEVRARDAWGNEVARRQRVFVEVP
jgi:hypothetical protein